MSAGAAHDLDPERIAAARAAIDPVFLDSPQYVDEQLARLLGREVVVKDETRNPLRSFKGRGACALVASLDRGRHLVCASAGNFGQAVAYAARVAGMPCTVFLAADANPVAAERIELLGAETRPATGKGPKAAAARFAAEAPERLLVEDGREAEIAAGAGTIGLELLAAGPLDAVVVPVGDGALITGVAAALEHHSPATRMIGVCAAAAPSMARSWRAGRPVPAPAATIADGLAITEPVAASLARMRALVDELIEVSEEALVEAMRLAAGTLGTLLEPSGAAALAALLRDPPPGDRVAVVLTGSLLRPEHLRLLLDDPPPAGATRTRGAPPAPAPG